MKISTGRWVSGSDFFDRETELRILGERVSDGNHILLTGQRRMGKTSVARELGRRLEARNWVFFFIDIEDAICEEDVIAEIAQVMRPIHSPKPPIHIRVGRFLQNSIEEIGVSSVKARIRAGITTGNWRRQGQELLRICAAHERPVLLVIDELPIFLKRMLGQEDGVQRVEKFLSWLRGALQGVEGGSLGVIVSGSIGLQPLVRRLGISDRINYLHSFRVGPWDRATSVECFNRLAESYQLEVEDGVATAVYEMLGLGIPHHVQSFFARLQEHAMRGQARVTVKDVEHVYRNSLLGPQGQIDLDHYASRLKEGLGDDYGFAMEILAAASVQNVFTPSSRQLLEQEYSALMDDAPGRIAEVLDILMHDGYLEEGPHGHRFLSHLLKDWWAARFRDHYIPLENRRPNSESTGRLQ